MILDGCFRILFSVDKNIFVINMVETGGIWAETADGRYKAYIYINSAPETRAGMTVSMKRLKVR